MRHMKPETPSKDGPFKVHYKPNNLSVCCPMRVDKVVVTL